MTDAEQRAAARQFAREWQGKGYEKGETQIFWIQLLRTLFGIPDAERHIIFEDQVSLGHTSFIDARLPEGRILIEQKSSNVNLELKQKQSDGSMLTPMEQAQRYVLGLPLSEHPRYIVVCNFVVFQVFDCEQRNTETILLSNLPKEYYRLSFLIDARKAHLKREMELSIQAGEIVGQLYEAILKKYLFPEAPETLRNLNAFCVRLVFCLYAEDCGLFGSRSQFHDYLAEFSSKHLRSALIDLFRVLNTSPEERDPYLDAELAAFPYVNGGLFADEHREIPQLDDEIKELLLTKASADFDWSDISPTIFGALFESTLNPDTRRSGGMHYTSIENIHKVIDPLFLDGLKEEWKTINDLKVAATRKKRLRDFQKKLASLRFLDPACGSGNFLTETYISLRRLENQVISSLNDGHGVLDFGDVIQISIGQFYGIEINDFAVTVAKTALWIAESQMMRETEDIVRRNLDFLPLHSYANIVEGNALRMDWGSVVESGKLDYIMGNPPFVGARMMDQGSPQKREVEETFGKIKDVQDLDYVCCWYKKAAQLIQNTNIQVAFVSTNSICQGVQVPILWGVLFGDFHVHIQFAYQTFKWESDASDKAAVHCVIIGFSLLNIKKKRIFTGNSVLEVGSISPYLLPGEELFVVAQKNALCDIPKMNFGNQPRDGGHFVLSPEEREHILQIEPSLEKWIRPYIGAEEFIKGKERWCLWLQEASPLDVIKSPILVSKVEAVKMFRLSSKAKTTNQYAKVPTLFAQITQPKGKNYIIVPSVSSERRKYVPMGFMEGSTISSNAVQIIPDATLYHFGVLTSSVHMAWMRAVCGRLKSDYRYSKEIVYNTFPWPEVDEEETAQIEAAAQAILDARSLYKGASLADLYGNKMYLFSDLCQAHQASDRAVIKAYGFLPTVTEPEIVAKLMKRYQILIQG